ncbi:conserved Plasmodium protein, unknown function [Plasmodium gallinaceum]|uniref:Uncharacterized protein n=1 Tax=Plasmodium gallinaceum TaxID=5849 RepID=A0A1J1GRP1_PLAGA|nr:conserved Plasmodium protein, unknown function [Plasmodium gallinaceum]CRG94941.1 conserved Plasmodium protein, unknown function [Plasmodium gallinaceum]
MTLKKFTLLSFVLIVAFLHKQLKNDFFLFKFFKVNSVIVGKTANDYALNEAISTILKHAPEENETEIYDNINKVMSEAYNNFNTRKILIRISYLIENGKLDYLCDKNYLKIILGIPQIISSAELLEDLKLYKLKKLIENIVNSLVICKPKDFKRKFYLESGGCQSDSDKAIIFDNGKLKKRNSLQLKPKNKFFSILLKCSVDNLGSGDKTMVCVKEELSKENLKISESCSNCFKDSVDCGKSNCWLSCLFSDPCGDNCFHCGVNYCKKDLISCTGLKNLPDACI